MPAMPIAESSAPIVVGMSATSSAISTVCESSRARVDRERPQRHDRGEERDRQAGEQDVERDLVRRLAPLGALDERDHAVEERLARLLRHLDDEPVREQPRAAGDRRAVAAGLADHRRRLAGDRRLVDRADALDDLAVGGNDLARLDDDDVAALQLGRRHLLERPVSVRRYAVVVVRVARSAFACALPRPSAIASAKFANSTVSQSQTAITPTNQSFRVAAGESRKKIAVVITLPISTMNITGLRTCMRGSSLGNESRTAASDDLAGEDALGLPGHRRLLVEREVELEHVDARLAEEAERAAVGVLVDQLGDRSSGRPRTAAMRGAAGARSRARCAGRCPSRRS